MPQETPRVAAVRKKLDELRAERIAAVAETSFA